MRRPERIARLGWRDARRLLSVPGPWILGSLGVAMATATTIALPVLGARPSGAAILASLPAIAGSLAAVAAGADFRYGSLATELLLAGSRLAYLARTLAASLTVCAALGASMACSAELASLLTGHPVYPAGDAGRFVLVTMYTGGCWGTLGASLAVMAGSPVTSVAGLLGYLLVLEPLLQAVSGRVSGALPGQVTLSMQDLPAPGHLLADAAWLATAALAVGACAVISFQRRNVAVTAT